MGKHAFKIARRRDSESMADLEGRVAEYLRGNGLEYEGFIWFRSAVPEEGRPGLPNDEYELLIGRTEVPSLDEGFTDLTLGETS
jgi:hypothetical protein